MLNDAWNRIRAVALATLAFTRLARKSAVDIDPLKRTLGPAQRFASSITRNAPHKRRRSTSWDKYSRREAQEMARRMRQIERGQLTASNGLVCYGLGTCNSHGVFDLTPRSV